MSRRVHNEDIELGSDSFLDIIANIVGILIILIVVAGAKVSRQPVVSSVERTLLVDRVPEDANTPAPAPIAQPEPQPIVPDRPSFATPDAPARFVATPQDKTKPRAVFDGSFDEKESHLQRFAERQRIMKTEITRLASMRGQASNVIDEKIAANTRLQAEFASLQRRIDEKRSDAGQLRRRLARAKQPQVDVHQIEHKVTPLGREVNGPEVHFRLAAGKISYVPVKELVEELKGDASRKQSALMSSSSYRGVVGPIKGYRMSYVIMRKRRSMSDDLRYGAAMFRVIVNEWEVKPTVELEQETLEQALRSGSLFDRRLLTLERDANVTFWVYPDSFDEYRQLQARVHRDGLTVAGRPLPFGVSIAGSPNGTKSSGQ